MMIQERGKVKRGAIVLEQPLALPDGTDVELSIQTSDPTAQGEPLESAAAVEDIRSLPAFGMWKDRDDMADSVEWVNRQRDKWNRYPELTTKG